MTLTAKYAASITTALLCFSWTSTSQALPYYMQSADASYAFPDGIREGFWAADEVIQDKSVIVKFEKEFDLLFHFDCHPDGNFTLYDVYKNKFVPRAKSMGIKDSDGVVWTTLRVTDFVPNQTLALHQNYTTNTKRQREFPNGKDYTYTYTPTLTPSCP